MPYLRLTRNRTRLVAERGPDVAPLWPRCLAALYLRRVCYVVLVSQDWLCGTDNKPYTNECWANCMGVRKAYDGKCARPGEQPGPYR